MPDKEIRAASLEYHRQFPPGKISIQPTKDLTNQRDLALAYTPGVAAACDEIVRDPAEARNLTARGNLVGVVTNGTAVLGLGAIGPLAAQAGHGGQGRPVQEVRRHRLFRHRDRRARPGQAGRHHRRARADVRRHQSRGHQGAGMLLRREEAARAPQDPGVPRRPARHGDHRRRRDHERPARRRQGVEGRQARLLGRRRCRARVPRPPRAARHTATEHLGRRHRRRRLPRPTGGDGRQQGALCAADGGAQARRHPDRCRRLSRPLGGEGAPSRLARADGRQAAHPGARQSRARDHAGYRQSGAAGRRHRDGALRLSEPGQQRAVFSVHLSRRARCRGHDGERGDEARDGAGARRPRDGGAIGHRRQCVRRAGSSLRSRVPDPEALRPAPHRDDRPRGRQGGDGLGGGHPSAHGPRGVPRTAPAVRLYLRPADEADLRRGQEGSEADRALPKARTSGCCARCRS